MAVRMTPKKKATSAPAKTKRKTKPIGANQTGVVAARTLPFSTNVSSPVQAVSKRRKKSSFVEHEAEDDDEDDEEDAFDSVPRYANGYARDSFIVADDEEEDDFVPLRDASRIKQKQRRELGPRITNDAIMESLSRNHRELVETFVDNAQEESKRIQRIQQLRLRPFSETVLRHIAIRLMTTKRELLRIPDINPEMVNLHGDVFLTMLKNLKKHTGFQEDETDDDDEEEQRPMDPNHQNVIDLVSDEEEEEDEYGGDSAFEEEDDEEDGPSPHFQMPLKPDSVKTFNKKFTQAQETAGKKVTVPKERGGKRGGKGGGRASGGAGFKKKGGWKNKRAGGGNRGSGGGGGGFRGIGVMPT